MDVDESCFAASTVIKIMIYIQSLVLTINFTFLTIEVRVQWYVAQCKDPVRETYNVFGIVVTTLDCGPRGSWFESRVGANILSGLIDCAGLTRAGQPLGVNRLDSCNFELCLQGRL